MSTNQRKRNLIHRDIQVRLIRQLLVHWLLFILAACAAAVLIQMLMNPLQSQDAWKFQLRVTLASFLLVSICLVPFFVRDSLKVSNRFVGPILRLQSFVQNVTFGDKKEIHFRKMDDWQSLANDLNAMIQRLRSADGKSRSEPEPTPAPSKEPAE